MLPSQMLSDQHFRHSSKFAAQRLKRSLRKRGYLFHGHSLFSLVYPVTAALDDHVPEH